MLNVFLFFFNNLFIGFSNSYRRYCVQVIVSQIILHIVLRTRVAFILFDRCFLFVSSTAQIICEFVPSRTTCSAQKKQLRNEECHATRGAIAFRWLRETTPAKRCIIDLVQSPRSTPPPSPSLSLSHSPPFLPLALLLHAAATHLCTSGRDG